MSTEVQNTTSSQHDAKLPVMCRLKAVQTLRNNPDLLLLMAEFKRANFVGSYIMQYQIETEEELAAVWLSQMEAQLFRTNGI
jgi:hypothetical protein